MNLQPQPLSQQAREDEQRSLQNRLVGSWAKTIYASAGALATAALARLNPNYAFAGLPIIFGSSLLLSKARDEARLQFVKNTYNVELSALSGIPREQLSLSTVEHLLESNRSDPRYALFNEYQTVLAHTNRISLITSAIVGSIVSAVTYFATKRGLHKHMDNKEIAALSTVGTATITGFVEHQFVKSGMETFPHSVNRAVLDAINQSINSRLDPVSVLRIYVKARPEVGPLIQQTLGKPFDRMTYAQKSAAVEVLDARYGFTETARKVNEGIIRPTELGWIAYGTRSGVPEHAPISASIAKGKERLLQLTKPTTQVNAVEAQGLQAAALAQHIA